MDLSKAKKVKIQRQGQRDGDNGDNYEQTVYVVEKTNGKKAVTIGGISMGTGAGVLYAFLQLFVNQPSTEPVTADNVTAQVSANKKGLNDTRSKMYANRRDLVSLQSDFDKHVALQDQWQKNITEKIIGNQQVLIEKLKDLKEEVKELRKK